MTDPNIKSDPISGNEGGVLARLWRNILKDLNLSNSIPQLVQVYTNKKERIGSSAAVKLKAKSSIINDITSGDMTWKVFFHNMFYVLNVKRMRISITLEHPDNTETIHHITISPAEEQEKTSKKDK